MFWNKKGEKKNLATIYKLVHIFPIHENVNKEVNDFIEQIVDRYLELGLSDKVEVVFKENYVALEYWDIVAIDGKKIK